MTITNTTRLVLASGNGATTEWPFTFLIPTAEELIVTTYDQFGVATVRDASTYSVSGIASASGGTVTYPLVGSPLTAQEQITIERRVSFVQPTSFANQQRYYPKVLEAALDRLVMQTQQNNEELSRALIFSPLTVPADRAAFILDVTAVADNETQLNTVADSITDVIAVAEIAEDVVAVPALAAAVEADRVQTGLDRVATGADVVAAAASETAAAASAVLADARADDAASFAGYRDYQDVATLLANTSLTYSAGDLQVAAGDVIRTRAEGFAYEVAASAATDQHVTTAGGVKLYVLEGEAGYNVLAFTSLANTVACVPNGSGIFCPEGYSETLTTTIPVTKSIKIYAHNWRGVTITGPANLPIFTGSGTVTNFILEGITWVGGAGASQLLKVNAGSSWFESKIKILSNKINNFGAVAIERVDSVYFTEIRGNRFDNCFGCVKEGWASDSVIADNLFNDGEGATPVLELVGGSRTIVKDNGFVVGMGSITGPDILLNPTTNFGRGGRVYIQYNKFGGEFERPNRPKIRAYNATADNRSTDVIISHNQLHGAPLVEGGTTYAIEIDSPIALWDISHNEFDEYNIIVKDTFTQNGGQGGSNKFMFNRFYLSTRQSYKLFENGGAQFNDIDAPEGGFHRVTPAYEPNKVQNRLHFSSAMTNWNVSSGVTITGGQSDPDGGTNAFLISRDGLSASQFTFRTFDTVGMGSDAIIKLRMKAGTANTVFVGVRDSTVSKFVGMYQALSLSTDWQDYSFAVHGLNPANAMQIWIYISSPSVAVAGDFYIYQPQVSDKVSDYIPTPINAPVTDTTIGRRFGRKVSFAGGAKAVLATYADNAAALAGGLLPGDIYKTAAGELRIVV